MAVRVTDGSLSWKASIDDADIDRIAAKIEARISGMSKNVQKEGQAMEDMFKKAATAAAGFFSLQAGTDLIQQIVKVRGEFQQLEIAFTTILGSKDKADRLMAQAVDLAATTPFSLQDVAGGAKQLLAYGFSAQSVTENLTMLGNIASGVSAPLNDIVYLYGTLQTQGRAYTKDIMQFTGRGIPIIAELAKQFGVAQSEVSAMVEAGKVGFPEVEKAFKSLTGQGGMFFNLMAEQSKSLTGQISNLEDAISNMFNEIGRQNQDFLSEGIAGIAYLVENYESVVAILGVLIATYGAYRAALALTVAVQLTAAEVTAGVTTAFKLQYAWTVLVDKAQKMLNATMLANPFVLAATLITALAASMIALHDSTTNEERTLKSLNDKAQEASKHFDDLQRKTAELTGTIRSETATKYSQILAYQALEAIYPDLLASMTLAEFQTLSLTKSQKLLNAELDKQKVTAKSQEYEAAVAKVKKYEDSIRALQEAQRNSASQGGGLASTIENAVKKLEQAKIESKKLGEQVKVVERQYWEATTPIEEQRKYWQNIIDTVGKQRTELENNNTAAINLGKSALTAGGFFAAINVLNLNQSLTEAQNKLNALISQEAKPVKRTISMIDGEIDKLKEDQKGSSNNKEYLEYQKKINVLQKERVAITGESEKAINKLASAQKKNDEERLSFLKTIADKEFEIKVSAMEKTEAEILKIQKEYQEKRAEAAKLKLGPGVIQRIDNAEKSDIGYLKSERDAEMLRQSISKQKQLFADYEYFKTDLGEAEANKRFSAELKGIANYGELLRSEIAKLSETPLEKMNGAQKESLRQLKEDLIGYNAEQQSIENQRFAEAYQSALTYNQNVEQINKKYRDQATILGKDITEEQKANLLYLRDQAVEAAKDEAFQKTEIYKKLSIDTIERTRDQVREQVKSLQALLADDSITGELKTKIETELSKLNTVLKIGVDESNIDQLRIKIEQIKKAFSDDDAKPFGEKILSEQEKNYLLGRIQELQTKIDQLTNKDNSSKSGFVKGLEENFAYLKGSTKEVAEGVSQDLGQLSGAFGELSGALGGTNTEAGYTLDTIGKLIGVASDAAGAVASFASGDVIGGITKTIKAVAGLFSIASKVREMNKAARKEIEDFYIKAAEGERAYQALLRQRDRDTVTRGKNSYNAIIAELELLKKQAPEVQAAYDKIFNALQGQSSIAGREYEHGTWFRKAKTWDVMASLMGSDYNQLEKLYTENKLKDKAKTDFEALKALREELKAAGVDIEELTAQLGELLTGTKVSGLADGLAELFENGKFAAADFAKSFEDIMKEAIVNSFKYRILEDGLEPFYKEFSALFANGIPGQSAIDALRQKYVALGEGFAEQFKELEKLTGTPISVPAIAVPMDLSELNNLVANLFEQGKFTAVDFGKTFEEIIKNSIINGFKAQVFADGLKGFYDKLKEFQTSGGSLTKEEIAELKAEYDLFVNNAQAKLKELEQLTGYTFAEVVKDEISGTYVTISGELKTLEDLIVNVFESGSNAAEDFAVGFEQLVSNTILNTFRETALRDQLTEFYEEFRKLSTEGDGLTKDKIAILKAQYDKIIREGQMKMSEFEEVTGVKFTPEVKQSALASSISRSITEDTASVLSGIWTATLDELARMGITMNKLFAVASQHLEVARRTEQHVLRGANNTDGIGSKLDQIINNTRKTPGSSFSDNYLKVQ